MRGSSAALRLEEGGGLDACREAVPAARLRLQTPVGTGPTKGEVAVQEFEQLLHSTVNASFNEGSRGAPSWEFVSNNNSRRYANHDHGFNSRLLAGGYGAGYAFKKCKASAHWVHV